MAQQKLYSPGIQDFESQIKEKSTTIARLLEEQQELYRKAVSAHLHGYPFAGQEICAHSSKGISIAREEELPEQKRKMVLDLDSIREDGSSKLKQGPTITSASTHARRELVVEQANDYDALHFGSIGMLDKNIDSIASASRVDKKFQEKTQSKLHKVLQEEIALEKKEVEGSGLVKFVVGDRFEVIFALLIIGNVVLMCVEAEVKGRSVLPGHRDVSKLTLDVFTAIQVSFSSLFTLELLLKVFALRHQFLMSSWNIFDMFLVVLSWLDFLAAHMDFLFNPLLLRLARLVRIIRLIRVARVSTRFEAFDTLHLMMDSMRASLPVILWVVLVIVPILAGSALILNVSLTEFIEDESTLETDRFDCYQYFGTFFRAFYTMYEVTFGNYGPISAFVTHRISGWWGIFFLSYKLVVGVAILRVIYAIFVHCTLACATTSDHIKVVKRHREMRKFIKKMRALFIELDASQDGYLSREEFMVLTQNPLLQEWVAVQDLEVRDSEIIFDMLAEGGQDKVSVKELIHGFARLRGNARSIDSMVIIELCTKTLSRMEKLYSMFEKATYQDSKRVISRIE